MWKKSRRFMSKLNVELKIPMSRIKLKPASTRKRRYFNLEI